MEKALVQGQSLLAACLYLNNRCSMSLAVRWASKGLTDRHEKANTCDQRPKLYDTSDLSITAPKSPSGPHTGSSECGRMDARATIQHGLISAQRPRGSFLRPQLFPASSSEIRLLDWTRHLPLPHLSGWAGRADSFILIDNGEN